MQNKLAKPWGPYGVGTVVADNAAEAKEIPGAVHVNPERFAKLHEDGHLAREEPARPIPAEVKTARGPGGGRLFGRPLDDDGAVDFLGTPPPREALEPEAGTVVEEEASIAAEAEKEP